MAVALLLGRAIHRLLFAVQPTDYGVVANTSDAQLTLTTCNPRYSAAQRLIVHAKLARKLSSAPHKPPKTINGNETIIAKGLTGPIKVKGQTWNGNMPAWKGTLTDQQLADVATYIRSAWGNKAAPLTAKDFASIK